MGISALEFGFLRFAFQKGYLPRDVDLLEFGEAELVYLSIDQILDDPLLIADARQRDAVIAQAREIPPAYEGLSNFHQAKVLYDLFFQLRSCRTVDLSGSSLAEPVDLNYPVDLGRTYGLCINNGTSEHIFNQYQFFKTVHDHTAAGGTMIHWTPTFGWVNHGLYNVQPTFFFDLCMANGYEPLLISIVSGTTILILEDGNLDIQFLTKHPEFADSLMCAVLRKTADRPFQVPQQGSYRHLKS